MSKLPTLPDTLAPDWHSLQELLDTYAWADVPCRAGRIVPSSWWTSDDPGERGVAAEACAPCPALAQCRAYGAKHPREAQAAVYGGVA